MKKLFIFTVACVALMACNNKNNAINGDQPEGSTNKAGQVVTIGVTVDDNAAFAPIRRVSGTDNGDSFSFKWEEGDMVKVTVRDTNWTETYPEFGVYVVKTSYADFELATGVGTSSATFTGEMPAVPAGYTRRYNVFDIQYPVSSANLSTQTYEEGKIASGLMQFYKSGCKLDDKGTCNVTLEPKYAILQLNLFGIARSVKNIAVKAGTATYTLTCTDAVKVGKNKDNATTFYIVMNETNAKLQIDVTMEVGTPEEGDLAYYETYGKGTLISCKTFAQSSAKIISAGTCVNMPAVSLTTVWAPVNCGYDPVKFKYGKLYQWGRKNGSGYIDWYAQEHGLPSPEYDDAGGILQTCPNPGSITSQIAAEDEKDTVYYNTTYVEGEGEGTVSYNTDWLATRDDCRWDATGGSEAAHVAQKTKYDPCPEGWRVPTKTEMATLMGSNTSKGGFPTAKHGTTEGLPGRWFNGSTETTPTTGVFLPVVGYRNNLSTAGCIGRYNESGTYWTSSVNGDKAYSMTFGQSGTPSISRYSHRASGYAVRCVQE